MPTSTPYPNGQVLVSSALTVAQINAVIQTLTCGMIGVNPPNFSRVRVSWQTEGQPFVPTPTNDVCFIGCVPENVDYRLVRDRVMTGAGTDEDPLTENWTYTRGWRISFVFYGPNAADNARAVHSAFFMDYFNDQLSLVNLYPLPDPPEPTRIPEEINAQWYERADFHILMYEGITESIVDGAVTSIEVGVYQGAPAVADNPVAETTIEA